MFMSMVHGMKDSKINQAKPKQTSIAQHRSDADVQQMKQVWVGIGVAQHV